MRTVSDTLSSPPISEIRQKVEETIEVIRPALRADGGDMVLHGVTEVVGVE